MTTEKKNKQTRKSSHNFCVLTLKKKEQTTKKKKLGYRKTKKEKNKHVGGGTFPLMWAVDPLQAVLCLCSVAHLPLGTKLYLHQGVVMAQSPNQVQSIVRWVFGYSRSNLTFLYHAIRRFNKWERDYNLPDGCGQLIRTNAASGLEKLKQTYAQSSSSSVTFVPQLLTMYQNMIRTSLQVQDAADEHLDEVLRPVTSEYSPIQKLTIYATLSNLDRSARTPDEDVGPILRDFRVVMAPLERHLSGWLQMYTTG